MSDSNRYGFEETVIRFEETCRNDQNISDYGKRTAASFCRVHYVDTYINSADRLRDQATRALYWYGRRFPEEFFDFSHEVFFN